MIQYSVTSGSSQQVLVFDKVSWNADSLEIVFREKKVIFDILEKKFPSLVLISEHKIYRVLSIQNDKEKGGIFLNINGQRVFVKRKSETDLLLEKMGMNHTGADKIPHIKAPMPGKVLKVLVSEGQRVKKGEVLFILEAMKMENAIKSPGEGVLKKVLIKNGDAVEKNQVLMEF